MTKSKFRKVKIALEGAKDRLHLFQANLTEDGSFESIVDGCTAVFHTASPVVLSTADPQRWYWVAKTLAEKAAWEYAQENGINLVILHPGFVIGPLLQPALNTSSQLFLNVLSGSQDFRDYQFVDVRDVASAHILAFENPSATGRYILVGTSITHSHLQHILQELYPSLNFPTIGERNPTFQVSKKKAESLGIKFMALEVSLKDTVESLMQKNFFKLPK
ncbi:UNVERIFIED_CONTAM: Cinnamoyl-CoA reductase 2 [Sesamum calycinum]|uniref:Cinnamoyl-CoA reductase 2 n=1 Tax=Sesamum calycinum TaxID=2727403 RepID=A0AAW2RBI9_9LAMI